LEAFCFKVNKLPLKVYLPPLPPVCIEPLAAAHTFGYKVNCQATWATFGQAVKVHLSPDERNPVEGKFGQAKVPYGLNKTRAKLSSTSTSWIAAIALMLKLVKLTRQALVSGYFS